MSFFEQLKNATNGYLTNDITFITDINKDIHSSIKEVFPNNPHYPSLPNLLQNARKMDLTPNADPNRFLTLINQLQICVSKERAEDYHRELINMINHEKYRETSHHLFGDDENIRPNTKKLTYNLLMDISKISWAHSTSPRFNQVTNNIVEITNRRIVRLKELDPFSMISGIFNLELQSVENEWYEYFRHQFTGRFIYDTEYIIPGILDNLANALVHIDNYTSVRTDHNKTEYKVTLVEEGLLARLIKNNHKPSELNYLCGSCSRPFFQQKYRITWLRGSRVDEAFSAQEYIVNLTNWTCTCGFWQNNRYPCIHVLQIAMENRIPVSSLCDERYLMKNQVKVFHDILGNDKEFRPISSYIMLIHDISKDFAPTGRKGLASGVRKMNETTLQDESEEEE